MKTAKELFEELGYTYKENKSDFMYERCITENVYFDCKYKCVTVCDGYSDHDRMPMSIDIPTFRAIQKQLEELGWL